MKYIRYLYILYSSGSQPVCRGTLVCREHLPSVPQLTGWDTIENHCMVYCVPCKTENDYTLFLWKTSSCSETLKDEHLNKGSWTGNVFISTLVQMFIFQCFWARAGLSKKQCVVIFCFTRDTVHHTVVLNRVSTSELRHTWQMFTAHQCAAAHRLRTTAV